MGQGYSYKCSECGNDYNVWLGRGMGFSDTYNETINDIKAGKYGELWRDFFNEVPYMAVDAERYLFICKECGKWKVDKNLSLYAPKRPEAIPRKRYGIKTVEEWGYVPYVMSYDLMRDYRLVHKYAHICEKCGKDMSVIGTDDLNKVEKLPCPECGTINDVYGYVNWD